MSARVRTRFAPSPTGYVHIGSLQKILYSYAEAKHNGGDYIVRVEDTDQTRYVEGAEKEIFDMHRALGITVDESPETGGKFGPYRQSERLSIYKEYAHKLVETGHAYYAFETQEEIAEARKLLQAAGKMPRYNGIYRNFPVEEAKAKVVAGEKYVIRIKVPENREIIVNDPILGEVKVQSKDVDDYILFKSDGYPTYHLAVVVDDHLMEITHAFRGIEWLPTAPIHVLLFEFFGWEIPDFLHIPNILDPKGGKLSKRKGNFSLKEFLRLGYLPEAIINFIILLGWSPKTDQEMFSLDEFVKVFSLNNLNKSNPIFNEEKLRWFNHKYIQSYSSAELVTVFKTWLEKYQADSELTPLLLKLADNKLQSILELERERVKTLAELLAATEVFVTQPVTYELDHKFIVNFTPELKKQLITEYMEFRKQKETLTHEEWEAFIRSLAEANEQKAGSVFMLLRIALTGKSQTPPLFEIMELIGQAEELARLANFNDKQQSN